MHQVGMINNFLFIFTHTHTHGVRERDLDELEECKDIATLLVGVDYFHTIHMHQVPMAIRSKSNVNSQLQKN